MDYKVILSRPALRDLGEIARYIAQDNLSAAERVGEELLDIAASLKTLPYRGGICIHGPARGASYRILTSSSTESMKNVAWSSCSASGTQSAI